MSICNLFSHPQKSSNTKLNERRYDQRYEPIMGKANTLCRICAGPLKIVFAFEPTMKLLSIITIYLFPNSTLLLISTNTSPKTLRLMRHRSNLGIDRSSFPSQTSKTSKSLQSHDFSSRRPQYFKSSISPWWKNQEKLERKEARLKLARAFIYRSSKTKFQNKTFFRRFQKIFINNPFGLREVPFWKLVRSKEHCLNSFWHPPLSIGHCGALF